MLSAMRTVHSAEYKAFLAKLIAARKARGMTQAEVAKALHLGQPQVSRMETGERMVNAVEFRHFATLYRKRLDYFV
jgi:transcriptional regulator with XRE-family HTH domain